MRSMDMPRRRLLDDLQDSADTARVWPGVPDGRARSPAELFDNLRLRLSELPVNHPSTPRQAGRSDSAGRRVLSEWTARADGAPRTCDGATAGSDGPAGQDTPLGTDQDDRDEAREARGAEDTRQGDPSDASRAGAPDEAILAARMAKDTFTGAADTGALAMMKLAAETGPSEVYPPWFMSGEQAVPWWAAGDDLWG
jgi:hypothetical protein